MATRARALRPGFPTRILRALSTRCSTRRCFSSSFFPRATTRLSAGVLLPCRAQHHMRLELNLVQIRRIIYMFSKNVQDATPVSIQMTRAPHAPSRRVHLPPPERSEPGGGRARQSHSHIGHHGRQFRTVRPQVKTLLENAKRAEAIEEAATRKAKESRRARRRQRVRRRRRTLGRAEGHLRRRRGQRPRS